MNTRAESDIVVEAEVGGAGGVASAAIHPPALPCLSRNNCIQPGGYRWKQTSKDGSISKDAEGRIWVAGDAPGVHALVNAQVMSGADHKRVFKLRNHAESFAKFFGRERSLFFTVTDGEGVTPREFAKRWHSLLTNESGWIEGYLRVLEPQKTGRPHFHNLVAVGFDVGPDTFDWEAFIAAENERIAHGKTALFYSMRNKYVASASPGLRKLWAWSRQVLPKYGLGRAEILPVRSAGLARYLGKYLEKGMAVRVDEWRGVRRFETDRRSSQEWKRCGSLFSWVSPAGKQWRKRCGELAFALGLEVSGGDVGVITRKLGSRWAYEFRGTMCFADDDEWAEFLRILVRRYQDEGPKVKVQGAADILRDNYFGRRYDTSDPRLYVLPVIT